MQVTKHTDSARENHLLAALPAAEFANLETDLEPVSLELGQVIYESGEQLDGHLPSMARHTPSARGSRAAFDYTTGHRRQTSRPRHRE